MGALRVSENVKMADGESIRWFLRGEGLMVGLRKWFVVLDRKKVRDKNKNPKQMSMLNSNQIPLN